MCPLTDSILSQARNVLLQFPCLRIVMLLLQQVRTFYGFFNYMYIQGHFQLLFLDIHV